MRKYARRVRILAPNCENVMLVMWVICESRNDQDMIKFAIARGVNLRASSQVYLVSCEAMDLHSYNIIIMYTKFRILLTSRLQVADTIQCSE